MKKTLFFLYAIVSYLAFFATILYSIGFVGNYIVPTTIDGTPELPFWQALLIDASFLLVFAVQHSVMARPAFKEWWTRYIPKPIERSTYVLLSSIIMAVMMIYWQPMGGLVWNVENELAQHVLVGINLVGWTTVLLSTFMINHFDLFGLRQVWLYYQDKPYTYLNFRVPYLYKYMRHPLYLGFLIAFWVTPTMTITHLIFAIATTGYILLAIPLEERDLAEVHGQQYQDYRNRVPMLLPLGSKSGPAASSRINS
ncbi:MAG: isoprenylcysteine carboxylmethyltransferase family protein [Bacteroidetes bacterium]|nr:MAG: isoprenylcysteine carboxylmethyltransferase family protein [Bacteroidota bacterium]